MKSQSFKLQKAFTFHQKVKLHGIWIDKIMYNAKVKQAYDTM